MTAPHLGEVTTQVDGADVILRFNWGSLARLYGAFGSQWEQELQQAIVKGDIETIAKVLEAGSDFPAAWWMDRSPPVQPVLNDLSLALRYAMVGPGDPAEEPEESTADPKVSPKRRSFWARLFGLGSN
ncbi:MAG: hypothetical protein AAGC81_01855 [Pseudomonadota bacterium]